MCGKKVGVSHTAIVAAISFLAGSIASKLLDSGILIAIAWLGALLGACVIQLFALPLEPR